MVLLRQEADILIQALEKKLLESTWDGTSFDVGNGEAVLDLRNLSQRLYHLWTLQLPKADENHIWNFQCIANNFKIKFVYHFNQQAMQQLQSVEMYFKFLDKYLDQNSFKCVEIFSDASAGLPQTMVHQQFVNHVLTPIREKVSSTLTKISNDTSSQALKTLIVLLSQIFIMDNALLKKHLYYGDGLIVMAVSYTHLDVYKRQFLLRSARLKHAHTYHTLPAKYVFIYLRTDLMQRH